MRNNATTIAPRLTSRFRMRLVKLASPLKTDETVRVEGGTPKAITPEGMHATAFLVSHDGQSVAGIGSDQLGYIYPTAEGDGRPIRGMEMGEQPIAWSQDGAFTLHLPPPSASGQNLAAGLGLWTKNSHGTIDAG